ncbi:MAG TPA: hypothetical protein [Caudoviricetes sp.]|nr:MAG TPA: hypothetical protein [Caudoviricetes sp.]
MLLVMTHLYSQMQCGLSLGLTEIRKKRVMSLGT